MAALGTITNIYTPPTTPPTPLLPIADYNIVRGRLLGTIPIYDIRGFEPMLITPLTGYVVRMIRVL
ncbi:MAG: hypothetical protein WBO09_08200 [Methylocystis silviterrae]|uniref:hypothetical protein n=1 Tax=Methylocystis silviterrae TaxID=2743612 RepID=UPI003C74C16E